LFHNSNLFGSCIIHILYTGCAKIKKNNSGDKRLIKTKEQGVSKLTHVSALSKCTAFNEGKSQFRFQYEPEAVTVLNKKNPAHILTATSVKSHRLHVGLPSGLFPSVLPKKISMLTSIPRVTLALPNSFKFI